MIDASASFERRDTKNVLTSEAIKDAGALVHQGTGALQHELVSKADVGKRNYNLMVRRYLGSGDEEDGAPSFEEAVAAYTTARAAREEAERALPDDVLRLLKEP